MANTKVTTGVIKDDAVGADQLASNAVVTASIVDNAITTAKINNDAILTAKISNSAVTNAKLSANSVDSDQYVDGSIDTAHIGDGQITSAKLDTNIAVGGTLTVGSHLLMGDGDILKMGASADLQIYHNGSNSIVSDEGTGQLHLKGNARVAIMNSADDVTLANFDAGGASRLMYAGSTKLATTSSGVDVTGVITTDGLTTSADINFGDSDKAIFGAGSDLQIYHDGSNSFIDETGTGNLYVKSNSIMHLMSDDIRLMNAANSETILKGVVNGAVTLYHDNSTKLATTSTGIDVTGNIKILDGYIEFDKPSVYGFRFLQNDVGNDLSIQQGDANNENYATRLNIGSTGNVGIGTNSPASKLHVYSSAATSAPKDQNAVALFDDAEGRIQVRATNNGSDGAVVGLSTGTHNWGLMATAAGTFSNAFAIGYVNTSTDGNVFGVSSMSEKLIITTSGTMGFGMQPLGTNSGSAFFDGNVSSKDGFMTTAGDLTLLQPSAGDTIFVRDNGNETMRISSAGDLIYATTGTTGSDLSNGGICFRDSGSQVYGQFASGTTSNVTFIYFYTKSGTGIAHIGSISHTGSTMSYGSASDYRLKENVVSLDSALSRVNQLQPKRFNFIADADTTVDGFLAHEVKEIVPEAITGKKDAVDHEGNPEYQTIDQSKLVPLLTKAIQEQQEQIETLKAEIQELKG